MTTADPSARAGLSRTSDGEEVPLAAERARRPRLGNPLAGWLCSLGVALLALGLRLWKLEEPRLFAFDETYYAKDAWSMIRHGHAREYRDKVDDVEANQAILNGVTTGLWEDKPSLSVHPEVGKWLIGLGEWAFGMDPFGWRVASAVVGALMVLVMCRLMRRMTGSTLLGCVAGLLLTLDGLHFVLSRLALLDIFVAFFLLCGVVCVVNDRYWFRDRYAGLDAPPRSPWGPVFLFRPWLLLGGVCFGLAVGTKWTALFPMAAFGLLAWLWSAGARRSFGVRRPVVRSALLDGVPAFVQLVLVGALVYTATWAGWLLNAHEYEEHYSATQYTRFVAERPCDGDETDHELGDATWPTASEPDATGPAELTQSLRSLWYYHQDVYTFHAHFLDCSEHTYQSDPLGWLLLNRPVGVAVDNEIPPDNVRCHPATPTGDETEEEAAQRSNCLQQVLLLGNPVLWWGGVLALLFSGAMWLGTRDWRFGTAVIGTLSTWLPWLVYDDRPIFLFYAIATLSFVVMALTLTMGTLLGHARVPSTRRTVGVIVGGSFVVLVMVCFAWFWPVWTNELLTRSEWLDRIWFERWI